MDESLPRHRTIQFVNSESFLPTLFALPATVVGGLFAIWAIRKHLVRKRADALRTEALGLGLSFEGDEWTERSRAPLLETALFGKGHSPEFRNVMTGSCNGLKVSMFDYSFAEGSGRSTQYYRQTVGAFSKPSAYLPYFEMRPSGAFDTVWDGLAHNNIHFESDPEFSRRYVLRGALNDKVQSLFTPALRAFLEGVEPHEKWRIEGTGDTLILYRYAKRTSPAELRTFLDHTSSIAAGFFGLATAATIAQ